jgi:hypothetical protein
MRAALTAAGPVSSDRSLTTSTMANNTPLAILFTLETAIHTWLGQLRPDDKEHSPMTRHAFLRSLPPTYPQTETHTHSHTDTQTHR